MAEEEDREDIVEEEMVAEAGDAVPEVAGVVAEDPEAAGAVAEDPEAAVGGEEVVEVVEEHQRASMR